MGAKNLNPVGIEALDASPEIHAGMGTPTR